MSEEASAKGRPDVFTIVVQGWLVGTNTSRVV